MFNRYKIKQLEDKISSLETECEHYKNDSKYATADLTDKYIRQVRERYDQLSNTIKVMQAENEHLTNENTRLRTAYNTEVLINDNLTKNIRVFAKLNQ